MEVAHDVEHEGAQSVLVCVSLSMSGPQVHEVAEHRLHVGVGRDTFLPVVTSSQRPVRLHSMLVHVLGESMQDERGEESLVIELAVVVVTGRSCLKLSHPDTPAPSMRRRTSINISS